METKKITPPVETRARAHAPPKPQPTLGLVRCTQCGDYFEAEHLTRRDLAPPILCVDCAFDDIPHTD